MWYKLLQNSSSLEKLYNKIPDLNKIKIYEINIKNEENKISIVFDLPYYADYPLKKWIDSKFNTVFVQVDFFVIHHFNLETANNCPFIGCAKILVDQNKLLNIDIIGTLKAKIKAETGLIQQISACLIDPWSEEF